MLTYLQLDHPEHVSLQNLNGNVADKNHNAQSKYNSFNANHFSLEGNT